jgi:small conductance mechanosensitive channel
MIRFRSRIPAATVALALALCPRAAIGQDSTATADTITAANVGSLASPATAEDSLARAESLFAEMMRLERQVAELELSEADLTGEDSVLVAERRLRRITDELEVASAWIDLIVQLDRTHPIISAQRDTAVRILEEGADHLRMERASFLARIAEMRAPRDTLRGAALLDHERAIARMSARVNENVRETAALVEWFDRLEIDSEAVDAEADSMIRARADDLADRIRIVVGLRNDARTAVTRAPEGEAETLALDVLALEERLQNNIRSLQQMVQLLRERGLETVAYRQLLITATGELTTDILDARVALGLVQQGLDAVRQWLVTQGVQWLFRFLIFMGILFLSVLMARLARGLVVRGLNRAKVETSSLMRETVLSITGKSVILLGILIGLGQMGVSLGPMLAGLGVAGFIVGFALQDTLANFASGFMIVVYEPYDVGDLIEVAGVSGKVAGMSLVATSIKTLDNQVLVIPNSRIWGDVIRNVTAQRIRRVDLTFGVAYDSDLDEVEQILTDLVEKDERVLSDPAPNIRVHELGDSAVVFIVRPWCMTDDYWEVYWDLTRAAKIAFDEAGVGIPFPQRDVHLHTADQTTATTGVERPTDDRDEATSAD